MLGGAMLDVHDAAVISDALDETETDAAALLRAPASPV